MVSARAFQEARCVIFWIVLGTGIASCASVPTSPSATSVPEPQSPAIPHHEVERPAETAATAAEPVLVGTVLRVSDGDTIRVQLSSGPISVRFHSIDAPEKDQPWGLDARAALAGRLDHQQVALEVWTQDRYERLVATVYLGDENINAWMVEHGHAWAYRDYMKDPQYCHSEAEARARHLGLWGLSSTTPYAPWEWRAHKRDPANGFSDYSRETAADCIAAMHGRRASTRSTAVPISAPASSSQTAGCRIKGNISRNGKIYHVPGSSSYEQTKIDESKGERWFCTETEARAAGWTAPR